MDGHNHKGLSDETLERQIEAALGSDPSPEFRARVRARVARERIREGSRVPLLWRWAFAACATVIVAVVGLSVVRGPATTVPEQVTIAPPESVPGAVAPVTPPHTPVAPAPVAVARVSRSRHAAAPARREVLISKDDAEALRQLIAVAARQTEPLRLPDLVPAEEPLPAIGEIVLEPITLSPIVRLDSLEGVRP
jgi:hypothetical protein